jgi:hypothetical protein
MAEAYDTASDGGALPVPARQMYYAVRRILLRAGLEAPTAHNFMNGAASILDQYLRDHDVEAADWDIIRDARGSFMPPHGDDEVSLSTLEVRQYLDEVGDHITGGLDEYGLRFSLDHPKRGPGDSFGAILYIEKEGFGPIIRAAGLQEEFDLAVCSSKGYSNKATRDLLVALWERYDVPVLVAHDFDKDGINIAALIEAEGVDIVDIGLRWHDVNDPQWGLLAMGEPVPYMATGGKGKSAQPSDPRPLLERLGASPDEIDFLCDTAIPGVEYSGQRVELNALVGQQFVDWLRDKLVANGVSKLVPDQATLEAAWERMYAIQHINRQISDLLDEAVQAARDAQVPDLQTQVSEALAPRHRGQTTVRSKATWDDVIARLVRAAIEDEDDV